MGIFSGIRSFFGANATSKLVPWTDSHSGSTPSTDGRHTQALAPYSPRDAGSPAPKYFYEAATNDHPEPIGNGITSSDFRAEQIPGSFPDELGPAPHSPPTDSEATAACSDYTPSLSTRTWTQGAPSLSTRTWTQGAPSLSTRTWAQGKRAIDGVHHHILNPSPAKTARQLAEHETMRHQMYPRGTLPHPRSKSKSPRRQRKDMYRSSKGSPKDTGIESDDSSSWGTNSSLGTPSITPYAQSALENAKGNILSKLPPLVSPLTDDGGEQEMAFGTHVPPTEEDEPMLAMDQLAISDEKEGDLGDHGADKQLHADQQHEDRRRERERIEEQKRIAAEQKRLRETGGLRAPKHRLVTELSGDWKWQIKSTLSRGNDVIIQTKSGNGLKAHDFEKVILPHAWLNDEIVNGSLEWLDDHVNTAAHRKCLSFSSFLWPRIKSGQSTDRLLRRLGISNAEVFLALETVLIPICAGNHWTLVVVRPKGRTVAHMDSMNPGGSPSVLKTAREWVKRVCGDKFVETQWSIAKYQAPLQINGNDCGAHVITNGVCIAKGVNPAEAYKATDMPLQRLRIAGMLLNRGFNGDFGLGNF